MAKRHPGLIPVARDHHDGLLLAVRLQQGEQANLKLWSHDPQLQVAFVQAFLEQHLRPHFAVEEEVVFPLAVEHVPDTANIVQRLIEDHRAIEREIRSWDGRENDIAPEQLAELGRRLEEHIRLEDRTLFPMMENAVPAGHLAELEKNVQKAYAERPDRH